jgi:hypothetical protein
MFYCCLIICCCVISFFLTGNAHKALLYEKYGAIFSSKIGKTKELDEEKNSHIVQVKLNYKTMTAKQRTKSVHNFFN